MSIELHTLIERLGPDTTLKIVEAYPGLRLRVPTRVPKEDHPLTKVLDQKAMKKLIENFGGELMTVPVARPWRIGLYLKQTPALTRAEIARKVGCSEDRVYQILRREKERGGQLAFSF